MPTLVTLSGDLADLVAVDFDPRRTKVWLEANADAVVDKTNNVIRLGNAKATVAANGTFSFADVIASSSTDINIENLQYALKVDYQPKAGGPRKVETFGWWTVTASANVAVLVAQQYLDPSYVSVIRGEMQGYVADAEAARDEAEALVISDLGTTDGQTRALIEAEESQTRAALSASYASKTGANFFNHAGALKWGPASDTGELTVRTVGDGDRSLWELGHAGSAGYIIHLTQKPGMGAGAALLGLGIDEGGRGLFVNNKKTGVGIILTQNDTITSATAYGMLINASSQVAPAFYYAAGHASAKPAVFTHNVVPAAGARLIEFKTSVATSSDTLIGYIKSDTGAFVWQTQMSVQPTDVNTIPLVTVGLTGQVANLQEWRVGSPVAYIEKDGTMTSTVRHRAQGAGASFDIYDTSGTANARRFRLAHTSGYLSIGARTDANGSGGAGDLLLIQHATANLGVGGSTGFGSGSKVVAVPNAVTVPTTNPTGGGVLYAEGGALKWRGSSGTVTTIASA